MNEILSKCIEELTKETPSIDYVRGMLETLLSMNLPAVSHAKAEAVPVATATVQGDEAAIMDAKARAALKTVEEMTTLS